MSFSSSFYNIFTLYISNVIELQHLAVLSNSQHATRMSMYVYVINDNGSSLCFIIEHNPHSRSTTMTMMQSAASLLVCAGQTLITLFGNSLVWTCDVAVGAAAAVVDCLVVQQKQQM